MKDLKELVSVITSGTLTEKEKVKKIETILSENPELVNARISNGTLRSVTSKYSAYKDKITLLHVAAKFNLVEVAECLIDKGADVNAISGDTFKNTPLHEAASSGSKEVVQLLLEHSVTVDNTDHYGNTPLHEASRDGRHEIAELLLAKGANPNAATISDSSHGKTPLHEAIVNGHLANYLEVIKALLQYKADTGIEDRNGSIPFHEAVWHHNTEALTHFLEAKANVNVINKGKQTALHIVVHDCCNILDVTENRKICEIANMLLERGADVHARDENGDTPLHKAATYRSVGLAELLLKHDANINEINNYGDTPLECAKLGRMFTLYPQPDSVEIVRFLTEQTKKGHLTKGEGVVCSNSSDISVEKHVTLQQNKI